MAGQASNPHGWILHVRSGIQPYTRNLARAGIQASHQQVWMPDVLRQAGIKIESSENVLDISRLIGLRATTDRYEI